MVLSVVLVLARPESCWLEASPDFAAHLAISTSTISILTRDDKFPVLARWNWRPDVTV